MAGWWLLTVMGAHGLAFVIVKVLPERAMSALGIAWVDTTVRSAFQIAHRDRSYFAALGDLFRGDLGQTLDGVPVNFELSQALAAGFPRLAAAMCLIIVSIGLVAFSPKRWLRGVAKVGSAMAFLPPFVAAFVAVAALLLLAPGHWSSAGPAISVLAIAFPAAALAVAQAARITDRNLGLLFVTAARGAGYSAGRIRYRLAWNLAVEIMPTLEKVVLGLFSAALFAESLLGQDGLGSLTLRAIRRNDTELILAVVLVFALTTSTLRVCSELVRTRAGVLPA
jgi:ABC-type dipeptide/oligopeptide/nickel transport system permease component